MVSKKVLAGGISICVILIIVAIVSFGFAWFDFSSYEAPTISATASRSSSSSGVSRPNPCASVPDPYTIPSFGHVADVLRAEQVVSDLPGSGSIRLRFYHFAGNCRFWDKSFVLKQGSVSEGNGNADITVWFHSDYAPLLKSGNFCDVSRSAQENGHFGKSSELGEAKLLWRYSGLLSYRDCFGL